MSETGGIFVSAMNFYRDMGFFDIVLPFLLIFAIVYGALEKTKIFGEEKEMLNAIIALSIGLVAVATSWVISFIGGFLPWMGVLAIIITCVLMVIAMFWGELDKLIENEKFKKWASIIAVGLTGIGAFAALGTAFNWWDFIIAFFNAAGMAFQDILAVVFFVVVFIVIYMTAKPKKTSGGGKE